MTKRSSHNHSHNHRHKPVNEGNLLIATLLNLVITLVEVAGGLLSNSLALLSDALHNLSDTTSTFIAWLATRIGKRSANHKKTFGYKRIEILAAMLNAVILIVICAYLFKEAYERIRDPQEIKSLIVIVVAMVGLGANLLAVALLHQDSKKNINVRAAYVHLIGDSLSSVVVILGAVAIQLFEIYWVDPVITILIGVYLIREAYLILREAVNILMQSSPANVDIKKVQVKIEALPEIKNIHHLHVWSMSDSDIHFEAHVELERDMPVSALGGIQEKIEKLLRDRYDIHHTTLQFEFRSQHSKNLISTGANDNS